MRKGMDVLLFDVNDDEGERKNVADQHPDVVKKIKKIMAEAHTPNPYYDKDNKPLFNLKKACEDNGVPVPVRNRKKK